MSNILSKNPEIKYHEDAAPTNFAEFENVVRSRRSVRVYDSTPVPDEVVEKVLDLGLLAPNSSNLQTWQFIWVKNPEKKAALAEACMGQQAAKTSQVLIACAARPRYWKETRRQMLDRLAQEENPPKIAVDYYQKLVPLVYSTGPFSLFGWAKKILFGFVGFFKVMPRGPFIYSEIREWSIKSCALACENIMLGFRAAGFDTCPMEGFDEVRAKKILGLGCHEHVCMIISAGKRAHGGVYGPQIRFDRSQFVKVL